MLRYTVTLICDGRGAVGKSVTQTMVPPTKTEVRKLNARWQNTQGGEAYCQDCKERARRAACAIKHDPKPNGSE